MMNGLGCCHGTAAVFAPEINVKQQFSCVFSFLVSEQVEKTNFCSTVQ